MKHYLLTGAAGFIGSHLVDHLLTEGVKANQLRLLILPNESLSNLPKNQPFTIIRGDIRDETCVAAAMRGVDIVYHLAARIDFDGTTYEDYKDVNVDATELLLKTAAAQKVSKFIFFSSIAVHGLPADRGDLHNISEKSPIDPSNLYGLSKWDGEELVRKQHQQSGLPYAIIRPASVYGPREKGPTLALYSAIKNHRFVLIGSGENKLHYVYVTDLVAAARLAELSKLDAGEYIIGGAEPTTLNEISREIAKSIGTSVPSFHLPTWLALVAAYLLAAVGSVLNIKVPLFPSRVRTMTHSYYYSIDKARRELQYNPQVSFTKGAQLTGQWYQKHHYL